MLKGEQMVHVYSIVFVIIDVQYSRRYTYTVYNPPQTKK